MNDNKKVTLIILLIVVNQLFTACEIDDIEVGMPNDLKIEELNMKNIKLIIMVPITNTNSFSFNIRNADIDLFLNDRPMGKVKKIDRVRIPRKSQETYPILFEIETAKSVGNIMTVIRELQVGRPTVALNGHINVGKFLYSKKIDVDHVQTFDLY